MKVVINADFGGFGLSDDAMREYGKRAGLNLVEDGPDKFGFVHFYLNSVDDGNYFSDRDIDRSDPALVAVVEEMGDAASGKYASLRVIEIPDDVKWYVEEYDGSEHIAEVHRTWR